MTAPDSIAAVPAVPRYRSYRLPLSRLRAVVPVVIAGLCWWSGVPGGPALLAVGVLGGLAVWREDGASPVDRWKGRFPDVPFGLVERLPMAGRRAVELESVCLDVADTREALQEARRITRGTPRRALDPIERELAGLVALAADLCWQLERLDGAPDVSAGRIARLEDTLGSVRPAVQQLRVTLLRTSAAGQSAHRPRLGSLLTLERDLTARQDCLDELEALS